MRTLRLLALTAAIISAAPAHAMMAPEDSVEDTSVKTLRVRAAGGVADVVLHQKRSEECMRVGRGWNAASVTMQAKDDVKFYRGCWMQHSDSVLFVGRGTSVYEPLTLEFPASQFGLQRTSQRAR